MKDLPSGFLPFPLLTGGHRQTIAAYFWPRKTDLTPDFHEVPLPGSADKLCVAENTPTGWKDGEKIVVLVHGLTGCYLSSYNQRLTHRFINRGYKVVRVNQRTCGPGFGLAKDICHFGRSGDLNAVLHWLQGRFSSSPQHVLGFSMGGCLALKLAGEGGYPALLTQIAAVSPPIDIAASCDLIQQHSPFFHYYFLSRLKTAAQKQIEHFREAPPMGLQTVRTLNEFDEKYTAVKGGFANAEDYYFRSSPLRVWQDITIPSLILTSRDDPCADQSALGSNRLPDKVQLLQTKEGGHVGWIGRSMRPSNVFWMDNTLVQWVD